MCDFSNETTHKARKPHRCCSCLKKIERGDTYLRWSGVCDGDFSSDAFHEDCRKWEIHINHLNDFYADEWMPLHEHVSEGGVNVLDGAPDSVRQRFFQTLPEVKL